MKTDEEKPIFLFPPLAMLTSYSAPYSGSPLSVPGIQTLILCTGVQGVKWGEMPLFIAIKGRKVPLVFPTTWIKRAAAQTSAL